MVHTPTSGSSWDDVEKNVSLIRIAGGLNKPLVIHGGGISRVLEYMPEPVEVDVTSTAATLNAEQLLTGVTPTGTPGTIVELTLPTVPVLAALFNASNSARTGTRLQIGSSFDFIVVGGESDATRIDLLLPGGGGWTALGNLQVTQIGGSALFRVRFTDVTVGAETATMYALTNTS